MRFEVPQFIEIEDKIFGPFTWKQFIYLCGGVSVAFVLFVTLPLYAFVLLGAPIAGISVLLAFYPVNNRPFSIFLESIYNFYSSTNNYRWHKKNDVIYRADTTKPVQTPTTHTVPTDGSGINSLARKLELKAIQNER